MPKPWTTWFDQKTLARGRDYADTEVVSALTCERDIITAEVEGSETYYLTITLDGPQVIGGRVQVEELDSECSCPVGYQCKHAVAALWVYERRRTKDDEQDSESSSKPGAKTAGKNKSKKQSRPQPPLPAEERAPDESYVSSTKDPRDAAIITLLKGPGTEQEPPPKAKSSAQSLLYMLDRQGLAQVTVALATGRQLKDGTWRDVKRKEDAAELLFRPPGYVTADDRAIVAQLIAEGRREAYGPSAITLVRSPRAGEVVDRLLATGRLLLADCTGSWNSIKPEGMVVLKRGPERTMAPEWLAQPKEQWRLRLSSLDDLAVLPCVPPRWISGHGIGLLVSAFPAERLAAAANLPPMDAATAHAVARVLGIPSPPVATFDAVPCVPVARLWRTRIASAAYAGRDDQRRCTIEVATLSFRYGDRSVRVCDHGLRAGADGPLRDHAAEERAMDVIDGFTKAIANLSTWDAYPWKLSDRAARVQAVHSIAPCAPQGWGPKPLAHTPLPAGLLPALVQAGWRVERHDGTVMQRSIIDGEAMVAEVGEPDGNDWFQLHLGIDIKGGRVDLAPALAGLVAGGEAAFAALERDGDAPPRVLLALGDGRMVRLGEDRLRRLARFIAALFSDRGDALGISPDVLLTADDLTDVLPRWLGADRLRALADRLRPLLKPGDMDPPAGFGGTLRPYQRHGLAWLQRLREAGAGGVLADDMGLGKTVQVLAHLALEQAAGRLDQPALVVAPASVAPNWVREAKRFVPGLRAVLRHGQDRHALDHASVDLVVTTYGTLLRDSAALADQEWSLLICDEAQFIKNANAKAAQAVRAVKARSRLSLTGTPVENHLGELWAQMHWLNPGLLGSRKRFDAAFRTPIEKGGDHARLTLLQRRIAPFLLRRTKALVATDLPAKTSTVLAVRLDGAQRDLYEAVRTAMDRRLVDALAAKGLNRSRIEVLDALLKLRQCCCDPRLVKTKGACVVSESAKLDALAELLPTLIEDGRRILIFSQFTSMLDLIDARLQQLDIARVMLTGETSVPARQALVDRFQRGEVPVFLISLKAGGTGLNLTAADTVVLYDPWWNPAVEDQAIDRAHRIGQDKPVFVYRLVAQGTVEERMLDLQARKRALADALYGDEERVAGDLSEADLAALLAPIDG